jgi:ADP-L-glycero-D-manno-heptose 6-epimerase
MTETLVSEKSKLKILITGGAGFIGSSLIEYLNQCGLNESNIDVIHPNWYTKWKNLVGLKYRLRNISIFDICNFRNYDLVVHLGANSSTTMQENKEEWRKNYQESVDLIDICANGQKQVPIIFASSASVYGSEEKDFSERVFGLSPTSFYAFSKLKVDEYIEKLNCPKVYSLRFFNVYGGKREMYKGPMSSVVHRWLSMRKEKDIELFKSYRSDIPNGEQKRDFIHISDICKVIKFIIDNASNDKGGIYNLGTGVATSYNQIANEIATIQNRHIVFKELPFELQNQYQYFSTTI